MQFTFYAKLRKSCYLLSKLPWKSWYLTKELPWKSCFFLCILWSGGIKPCYKGECTLVEVKASSGNIKSTKTILNHPEKYHVNSAIKLGDYNIGRNGQILTLPLYMAFMLKEYWCPCSITWPCFMKLLQRIGVYVIIRI